MNLLTVKETARELRSSQAFVYQLCADRKLVHIRVGTGQKRPKILIREADLDSYLRSCQVEVNDPQPPLVLRHLQAPGARADLPATQLALRGQNRGLPAFRGGAEFPGPANHSGR